MGKETGRWFEWEAADCFSLIDFLRRELHLCHFPCLNDATDEVSSNTIAHGVQYI